MEDAGGVLWETALSLALSVLGVRSGPVYAESRYHIRFVWAEADLGKEGSVTA